MHSATRCRLPRASALRASIATLISGHEMKLAHKFTIAVTCAIVSLLALDAIVRVKREVALFDEAAPRRGRLLARTVANAAAYAWQDAGEPTAVALVERANEHEAGIEDGRAPKAIRWVWLDAPMDHAYRPSVELTALGNLAEGRPVTVEAEHAIYTYVMVPGPRRVAIEVGESMAERDDYLRGTIAEVAITSASLVALCAIVVLSLGTVLVGRPIRKLVEHARRIADGDLETRLDLGQRDEIGALSRDLDTMAERLAATRRQMENETTAKLAVIDQLRHADRLATVGKLSAGIAHEVGTPLNVIMGHAQLITSEYEPDSPAHTNAVIVDQQAHRVAEIIRHLMAFARPRKPQKIGHDLGAITQQVVALLDALARKRDVTLEPIAPTRPIRSHVDAGQLEQVLTNLVVNAIHATPGGGSISVGVTSRHATVPPGVTGDDGTYACIFVRDRGMGIAPELLPHIFEPFFTTKDIGEGTGLGLSVAHGIVKEHGGWIAVTSEVGVGTTFEVYLPAEDAA